MHWKEHRKLKVQSNISLCMFCKEGCAASSDDGSQFLGVRGTVSKCFRSSDVQDQFHPK